MLVVLISLHLPKGFPDSEKCTCKYHKELLTLSTEPTERNTRPAFNAFSCKFINCLCYSNLASHTEVMRHIFTARLIPGATCTNNQECYMHVQKMPWMLPLLSKGDCIQSNISPSLMTSRSR